MAMQNARFPGLENKPQRLVPEGFRCEEAIMSEAEEAALAISLALFELNPFEFHGHLGNRRVAAWPSLRFRTAFC
jgi:hypothetical protein